MNEKIRELAELAGIRLQFNEDSMMYEAQVDPDDLEAFAELIIKECANVSLCIGGGDNETELLKQFGVKE